MPTYFSASALTGIVTTMVTNPVDVVKTKMFVSGEFSARRKVLLLRAS